MFSMPHSIEECGDIYNIRINMKQLYLPYEEAVDQIYVCHFACVFPAFIYMRFIEPKVHLHNGSSKRYADESRREGAN